MAVKKIISGKWAIPVLVAPVLKFMLILRSEDEIAKIPGIELVNKSHPQVIEIWNLVFIQFNRKANGQLEELPAKHVDTGMGFERLCMAIQGVTSNYDTDIFQNTITEIGKLCNIKYGDRRKNRHCHACYCRPSARSCFCHCRRTTAIEQQSGYVIRRILRRAVRYGYTFLNFREAFIYKLVEVLKETMGDAFPELKGQQVLIEKVIKEEEESFLRTLSTGIRLLDEIISKAKQENRTKYREKMPLYCSILLVFRLI